MGNKTINLQIKKYLVTLLFFSMSFFCIYVFTNDTPKTYNDCGIVKAKSNVDVTIKHGYQTKLYLAVDFEKHGFEAIEVTPTTFFKYNVGDRVCFDLYIPNQHLHNLFCVLGLASFVGFCICGIIYLAETHTKCEEQ